MFSLVIPVWWLDVRLLNFLETSWWGISYWLITYLPWIHRQDVKTNLLPTWSRVWGLLFLDQISTVYKAHGSLFTALIQTKHGPIHSMHRSQSALLKLTQEIPAGQLHINWCPFTIPSVKLGSVHYITLFTYYLSNMLPHLHIDSTLYNCNASG